MISKLCILFLITCILFIKTKKILTNWTRVVTLVIYLVHYIGKQMIFYMSGAARCICWWRWRRTGPWRHPHPCSPSHSCRCKGRRGVDAVERRWPGVPELDFVSPGAEAAQVLASVGGQQVLHRRRRRAAQAALDSIPGGRFQKNAEQVAESSLMGRMYHSMQGYEQAHQHEHSPL